MKCSQGPSAPERLALAFPSRSVPFDVSLVTCPWCLSRAGVCQILAHRRCLGSLVPFRVSPALRVSFSATSAPSFPLSAPLSRAGPPRTVPPFVAAWFPSRGVVICASSRASPPGGPHWVNPFCSPGLHRSSPLAWTCHSVPSQGLPTLPQEQACLLRLKPRFAHFVSSPGPPAFFRTWACHSAPTRIFAKKAVLLAVLHRIVRVPFSRGEPKGPNLSQ